MYQVYHPYVSIGKQKKGPNINWVQAAKLHDKKDNEGLGFHDLEPFNETFSAKQFWCILNHPNSLPSRILKTNHFPGCCLFEVGVGYGPNFT